MREGDSPLLTDLYQLNMCQAYLDGSMDRTAVFELFFRKLPARRGFLLAAGLEQVLQFLESVRFTDADIEWLRETGRFGNQLLDYLAGFRFSGDVDAMPEGTAFFPDEPVIRVVAPLPQAQLLETRILNLLHFQTLIASKAARMVLAAPGKSLVDFGLRRAHGAEAGLLAARASYVAGFDATATLLAGRRFGMPVQGTMAHSFIQAHDDEVAAFRHFARSRPESVVLLIDTYDTEAGARKLVDLAPELRREGITIHGVRIDSGDLGEMARTVRTILDAGGLDEVRIIASGGLDEYELDALVRGGAPIDGFGVGTALTTSSDAPALDCAYKMQEYAGLARRKRSAGKATWPGRKQIWRRFDADGTMAGDTLSVEDDQHPGEPLLVPVMRAGERLGPAPELDAVRAVAARNLAAIPAKVRTLTWPKAYSVTAAQSLLDLAAEVDRRTG